MSKLVKAYKYDGKLYSDEDRVQCLSIYTLYRKLEDEEKVTTVLDYGRPIIWRNITIYQGIIKAGSLIIKSRI